MKSKRSRLLLALLASALILFNIAAFMQAHAMTHFATGGNRTAPIQQMDSLGKVWALLAGVNMPRPENRLNPEAIGLKYETRMVPTAAGGTLETWLIPHPNSRGLVLMFHGYATSKESLLSPAAAIYALGYSTLMVDFRGSGGSSGDDTTLGAREGEDVKAALDYANKIQPDGRIVLYGVSMGAAAILRAVAADGANPRALILESGFDNLVTTVGHRFEAMGLPSFPGAGVIVFWGSLQQGFNGFSHNPAEYAAAVTAPALVLHGASDPWISPSEAHAVADNLRGPTTFVEFPGAGHVLLVDAAHDKWQTEVGKFLQSLEN